MYRSFSLQFVNLIFSKPLSVPAFALFYPYLLSPHNVSRVVAYYPKPNTNPITKPFLIRTAYFSLIASPCCRLPFSPPSFPRNKSGRVVEPIIKFIYSMSGQNRTAAFPKIPPKTKKAAAHEKDCCQRKRNTAK